MSVPLGKRKTSELEVFNKARNLAVYTIRICSNEKVFLPRYADALTNNLISTATSIYVDLWTANNIRVNDEYTLNERLRLQKRGVLTKKYVDDSFRSRLSHLEKGNTFKVRTRLVEYYKNLWKEL